MASEISGIRYCCVVQLSRVTLFVGVKECWIEEDCNNVRGIFFGKFSKCFGI
jgi:hypothetical protein